jgi:class 3 adenylate cyclase
LGDSVNTASRLESFDKDWTDPESRQSRCRIVISEATQQLVSGRFQTRQIGAMPLKNKAQRVILYSVTGATEPPI